MIIVNPTATAAFLRFTPRVYPGGDLYIKITEKGTNNPVEIWVTDLFIQGYSQGNIQAAIWTSNQDLYTPQYDFKEGCRYDMSVRLYGDPTGEIRYRDTIYATAFDKDESYAYTINADKLVIDTNNDNDGYIILED